MSNNVSNAGVYHDLKQRLMMFEIAPGHSINESELSRSFGVSRTPLRAALYRLEAEGFLTHEKGRGFRCRTLEPKSIFDLYEMRCELEVVAVRKSCELAAASDVTDLVDFCLTKGRARINRSDGEQLDHDELFHRKLANLCGNRKVVEQLDSITGRIRFVRWIDMPGRVVASESEHLSIATAVRKRDADTSERLLRSHICRRIEQIHQVIKTGYFHIFTATGSEPATHLASN